MRAGSLIESMGALSHSYVGSTSVLPDSVFARIQV